MERVEDYTGDYLYFYPDEQAIGGLPPHAKIDWAPFLFDRLVKKSLQMSRSLKRSESMNQDQQRDIKFLNAIKHDLGTLATEEILNDSLARMSGITLGHLYQK